MNAQLRNVFIALTLMIASAVTAWAIAPTHRIAIDNPINIEATIPKQFGEWHEESNTFAGVINPQQTELLNKLYSQTVSRTYINRQTGVRVMLSIAYGEDQRDGMQMHYPEVCYPAQGFQLLSSRIGELATARGVIPVRRIETVLDQRRYEPVTYWTMIGERAVLGGIRKKLAEMRYGLRGQIADGLLFRVSTINRNSQEAFATQEQFVGELIQALPPASLKRLTGLGVAA